MKTLVVIVTRNNPELIKHTTDAFLKYSPGCDVDYFIMDNASDPAISKINEKCAKKLDAHYLVTFNDRVEHSFELATKIYINDIMSPIIHSHVFFCHDDCVPHKNGWLKAFHDRMQSGYAEPETPEEYRNLPIGRVGAMHHFWRSYDNIKGYPVQCLFLKACFEALFERPAPPMFKYADVDRVLVSTECLKASEILHTAMISRMPNAHKLPDIFAKLLPYYDIGTYPKEKYPAGQYWNRMTLLAEFLNSLAPLSKGFRTVGVRDDGYLEHIHGNDVPFGHDFIAHYGAPNALLALAKTFNTNSQEIKKKMNDPIFLIKTQQFFQKHYKSHN